jgi:hypothetical protein
VSPSDTPAASPGTPSAWAQWRAVILGFVVLVHGIRVAPLPHKVHAHELKDPVAQEEVARWSERLSSLGYPIEPEELGTRVVEVTELISSTHRGLTQPFRPWFRWTGTDQGWALFANPDTHPSRLRIDGVGPAGRRVLFQSGDPEHTWLLAYLKHRRLRPIFDAASVRRRPNGPYRRLVDWIWSRAQVDHPDLSRIEAVLLETHPVLPGSGKKARRPKVRHTTKAPR